VIFPQIFWFKKMRRSIPVMFVISLLVNVGMWFERFVITVTSLHRDFLPFELGHVRMVALGCRRSLRQLRHVPDDFLALSARRSRDLDRGD